MKKKNILREGTYTKRARSGNLNSNMDYGRIIQA